MDHLLFPLELIIADLIAMICFIGGSIFLIKFANKLGSPLFKKNLKLIGFTLIFYSVFHEGSEIITGLFNISVVHYGSIAVVLAVGVYFVASFRLKDGTKKLFSGRVKSK